ncbi:hypothetical protein Tco_0622824, partial [Tanacetum coccineum]
LGRHLKEIHVTWAHLEKKRTRLRLFTKSLREVIIQTVETVSPTRATTLGVSRRRQNVATSKETLEASSKRRWQDFCDAVAV